MTSDQVEIINKPRGVLETEAVAPYFTGQPLIGASPRCLLLGKNEEEKDEGQTLFTHKSYQWSQLVCVIIPNALLNPP